MATTKDNGADSVQFFEGVEKLLEIWFTSSSSINRKQGDLRQIPQRKWQSLLKIVRCEIISICRTEQVDAYVLSESSMFLSKRRLILKTCGTTTPLQCLEPLLELVKEYTSFEEVENVFYSRKNYKKPELQISPHQAFEEEVALLDTFFADGEAYCLGSVDTDCWYLYTLNREKPVDEPPVPDQTLEILMTHLDPEVMAIFTRDVCSSADEATQKSGIDKLIPNMIIDDFLFEPCGYSMNGVSKNGNYMTIHITPEPEFSYVSFESNIPETSYEEIIRRVLNAFKPQKFVVTIFANKESIAASCPRNMEQTDYLKCSGDWLRTDDENVPLSCSSEATRRTDSDDAKDKWNMGEVHITCNPLSTPYPYSTPHRNTSETITEPLDDEPKSRSCGSFLPILSLIPQTVVSFQYLSPKMKFSWWRNKIS